MKNVSFMQRFDTGLRYESPPETASLTFDDDGYCTRLTAGVVMDPTLGEIQIEVESNTQSSAVY